MSEKKPLQDELLREIVPQLKEYRHVIDYDETHLFVAFRSATEADKFISNELGFRVEDDRIAILDLYRLAAMGRAWVKAVGDNYIVVDDNIIFAHIGSKLWRANFGEGEDYTTELSATFAAIAAVWERGKR